MSLATAMGVWAIVLGCFILMHGAALVALDVLQRAWRRFLIPNVVVMLLAITPSVFVGDRLVQLTAANDVTVITLQNFFFYLVISELFVLIYHRYVRHSIEVGGSVGRQSRCTRLQHVRSRTEDRDRHRAGASGAVASTSRRRNTTYMSHWTKAA